MSPLHRNSWLALTVALAGCTFDPGGTGESRTSRSGGDSVRVAPDSGERSDAADPAGEGLRSGEGRRADAGRSEGAPAADGSAGWSDEADRAPTAGTSGAAPSVSASAEANAANGGSAIVDAGALRPEDDAGDDSDSGTAPLPPEAPAAGAGAAGMGGSPAAGASAVPAAGTGGVTANDDRDVLLSLLDIVISVLQIDPTLPAGELLIILAGASSADPALLGLVLDFIDAALVCEAQAQAPACARTCALVQARCEACVADAGCRASAVRTCGAAAEQCTQ